MKALTNLPSTSSRSSGERALTSARNCSSLVGTVLIFLLPFSLYACGEEPRIRSPLSALLIKTGRFRKGRTLATPCWHERHSRLVSAAGRSFATLAPWLIVENVVSPV